MQYSMPVLIDNKAHPGLGCMAHSILPFCTTFHIIILEYVCLTKSADDGIAPCILDH